MRCFITLIPKLIVFLETQADGAVEILREMQKSAQLEAIGLLPLAISALLGQVI